MSHIAKRDGGWRIHFAPTDAKDGASSFVDAKTVVLAAGTLGSTEILLRSRERGLGVSDRLGMSFSANGDIIAFALGGQRAGEWRRRRLPAEIVGDASAPASPGRSSFPTRAISTAP